MIDFKCGSPERHLVEKISQHLDDISSVQCPAPALSAVLITGSSSRNVCCLNNLNITHLQYEHFTSQYEHYKLKLAGFSSLRCSPASTSSTGPTISPWQTSSPSSSRYLIQEGLVNIHSSIHIKLYHQYCISSISSVFSYLSVINKIKPLVIELITFF